MIVHKNVLNSFLVNNCRLGRVDTSPPSLIFNNNNNMALQVWLPLINNVENQGVSNIPIINNGVTFIDNGKIGKCASFNNNYFSLQNLSNFNTISVSFWMKPANTSQTGCLLNYRTGIGLDLAIFLIQGKIRFDAGGQTIFNYTYTTDWQHVTVTYDGNIKSLYINGILNQSITINKAISCTATKGTVGASSVNTTSGSDNNYIGLLNDYRIYDHCLSPKEVKEISKGLVLHYPLNSLVNPNLVKNSYFCTNMHKGTVEVVPNVGYVDNTAYYGSPAYHVFREGQETIAYSEFQFIFRANKCVPGKQYCISFWVKKCHSGGNWGNIILDGLRWFKTGDNIRYTTSITWNNRPSESLLNVWQYVSFYFTFPVECTAYAYYYNTVGKDIDYYISKIKVEEGTISTPWCDYGITNNIVYDCSGYQNNGTISGSLSCSADSPRYKVSINMSGQYISCNTTNIQQVCNAGAPFTISSWIKRTANYTNSSGLFEAGSSSGNLKCLHLVFRNTGQFVFAFYSCDLYPGFNINNHIGEWNLITCTYDGSTMKVYINGELIGSRDGAILDLQTTTPYTVIGKAQTANSPDLLSDFRIYATALSEEDIKELYNTSCIINS